jgi:hypothetical protein
MNARVAQPHGLPESSGIGVNVPFGCFAGPPARPSPCALGHATAHTKARTTAPPILACSMRLSLFEAGRRRVCHESGYFIVF